ncbi:MAG TPA: DUF2784 domain-containing protein [Terriglobales bacterium]|nr:DUF2784 domain-containing protein [Terriglobales bacterium]
MVYGPMPAMAGLYLALAECVLALHLAFILWVVFGVLATRRRPLLRWLHISSLAWGILVEITPWPCPLTLLENWLERKAEVVPYQGGFLLHYLDKVVYPDISPRLLTMAGLAVCAWNLAVYLRLLALWYFKG